MDSRLMETQDVVPTAVDVSSEGLSWRPLGGHVPFMATSQFCSEEI